MFMVIIQANVSKIQLKFNQIYKFLMKTCLIYGYTIDRPTSCRKFPIYAACFQFD